MSKKVQVAFDFNAETSTEVSVKEGEFVTLIEIFDDGWAKVSKNTGEEGLIPSDYISEVTNNNPDEIPSNFGNNMGTTTIVTDTVEEPNFNDDEHVEERKNVVLPPKPKITPQLKEATNISQELLDSKEQELNSREHFVGIQEQYLLDGLDANGNRIRDKPNFPICCPILHHDFRAIKGIFPKLIAIQGFILWLVLIVILFLNFGCSIAIVSLPTTHQPPVNSTSSFLEINGQNTLFDFKETKESYQIPLPGQGITDFYDKVRFVVSAFLQFILIIPLHFFLCYWPLYKAMVSLKTPRFILFFIAYDLAIIYDILSLTGAYELGFTGVYAAILYLPLTPTTGNLAALIINCVMFAFWFLLLVCHCFLVLQVFFIFRRENFYFQKVEKYLKALCLQCCSSALKKAVKKPNTNTNSGVVEENGIVG